MPWYVCECVCVCVCVCIYDEIDAMVRTFVSVTPLQHHCNTIATTPVTVTPLQHHPL
jgi:hypothetical protein